MTAMPRFPPVGDLLDPNDWEMKESRLLPNTPRFCAGGFGRIGAT